MLAITESATGYLAQLMAQEELGDETAVRLFVAAEGIGMRPDEPAENDTIFEHEGRVVLVVDEEVNNLLDGRTLDVSESPEGTQLVLKNSDE